MKKLVVLTGAGISAESGIPTFRDSGGLWEGHDVAEVATPEAWQNNPGKVLEFYNQRRRAALEAQPNRGHQVLAELQDHFDVHIITQNIDNLHERAGSKNVLHLHGSIFEARSTADETLIYPIDGWELNQGELCEKGTQLRPNVVWFGEMVPAIEEAARITLTADFFVVAGTSLLVYPAAGLLDMAGSTTPKYLVDPGTTLDNNSYPNLTVIRQKAGTGMDKLKNMLLDPI